MSTVGDIYRVVTNVTAPGGSAVQNVFYFQHSGIAGVADATLVAAIGSYLGTLWGYLNTIIDSDSSLDEASVERVNGLGEIIDELGTVTIGQSGTATGDALPPGNAALITVPTAFPKVRARKYLGGLGKVGITEGLLNAGALAALTNFATNWLAGFTASGVQFDPGVISKSQLDFVLLGNVASLTNNPAYQRRRRFGTGI